MAIGAGALGTSVWLQREPTCHRWHLWRARTPTHPIRCGDDWGFGAAGGREPRQPRPGGLGGTAALDPPGRL
jgi:hypothetical protein